MDYFTQALWSALVLLGQFDPDIYQIVWVSLKISLVATLLAGVFGVYFGIIIAIKSFAGKKLLQQILNTLMATPTVMIGLLLYGVFSRQGPLGEMGLLYTQTAIVIGDTCLILPLITNMARVAVQNADSRLVFTLQLLGAKPSQQIIPILIELRQVFLAAIVTAFGRAIGEVGIAMMLGGNIYGTTRTMTTAIALETSKGSFEFGLALGLLLLLIAFVVNLALQALGGTK